MSHSLNESKYKIQRNKTKGILYFAVLKRVKIRSSYERIIKFDSWELLQTFYTKKDAQNYIKKINK